jgi:phosphate transport system permease protein
MAAVGFANGSTRVYFVTTEAVIGTESLEQQVPVERVIIAPKDDGLLAFGGGQALGWEMDPAYPETTMGSLFGKVWYEGYDEPRWQWQSSASGVGSEMKLSMVPLIFGTLKATFYAMLFATPLALMAAIYTSEFLAPSVKSTIKPTVESMASLPSVVLGFLAALVFAPYVEYVVPTVLAAFLTVPFVLTLSAFLWHLLPYKTVLLLRRYRFYFMLAAIVPGLMLAYVVGPWLEYLFFSGMVDGVRVGDMRAWLDGANRTEAFGTGTGGWMLVLLPISALFVAFTLAPSLNSWLRDTASRWSRHQFAGLNLLKFLVTLLVTVGLAYGASYLINFWGWDPRGSYLDTYQQRNALIVGIVMGFAVIPIIYTLADDALSAVPPHLRSASLGCGATPWQTAVRVVIPTAMSGLFSAVMVGLGRAVGETMIVLMAAGNTPILDMNLFSGMRTLSANIAVELPEAVPGDAHYRTLFLAALLLFLMTFVVNTLAELVRLRFRKRAYQL